MKKLFTLLYSFCLLINTLFCQISSSTQKYEWAERQLKQMNLEQKIAQLVIIRIHSNYDEKYNQKIIEEITKYQPGGVCFFQGGPVREINLTNRIQAVSNIPLLVSIDGEWGVSMRLDSVARFPRQMTLGALMPQYDTLIYEMGKEVARQCKILGIHLNYAPVIDVNNNKKNPVINSRSFGEDKNEVVRKAVAYFKGMETEGIVACAKHFPGHGDTETDSHYGLPVIKKSKEEMKALELYPFQQFINQDVKMIMISHLNISSLDPAPNSIATLSSPIITDLLKKEMGFKGIVITDGMEMDGLRKYYSKGAEAEIKALLAGVDILLLPNELSIIIPEIKSAVENGIINEKLIDEKCLKILQLKEYLEITTFSPLPTEQIYEKLNSDYANQLIAEIEARAITLVKNNHILPLKDQQKSVVLLFSDAETDNFIKDLCKQYKFPFIKVDKSIKRADFTEWLKKFDIYQNVIVCYLATNQQPARKYGITGESVAFLQSLAKNKRLILSVFGNPYSLEQFEPLSTYQAVIVGYQRTKNSVDAVFSAILGKIPFEGRLPVSVLNNKALTSAETITIQHQAKNEDKKSILPKNIEKQIDSMMLSGIKNQIFPGSQILSIKNGKTIFSKNYGSLTYDDLENKVTDYTLYDIASITKSVATTLAVMKLYDEKKIKLKDTVAKFLPYYSGSDKAKITVDELLTHTSGLPAFLSFSRDFANDSIRYIWLNDIYTPVFNVKIADQLYLNEEYINVMRREIRDCKLKPKKYLYSDLSFVILKEIVEQITQQKLEDYLSAHFYQPLGLKHTFFNPLTHNVLLENIAPTENDTVFRMQLIRGYVHDPTSALLGGNGGNAGLFSTAQDLAVILQMLMNKGVYDGKQYLTEKTVNLFITTYPLNGCNRRSLGFDTPNFPGASELLPSKASKKTFGHQGFTGTVFWCDPEEELIYIFLSNRVYPNVEPNKLSKSKIRLLAHEKIYEGLSH